MSRNHAQPPNPFLQRARKGELDPHPPVLGSPLPAQPCGMAHIKHQLIKNVQRQFPLVLNPQAPMGTLRSALRDSASHQGSSRLPKNTAQHTETMSNTVSFVSVCACVYMCMCTHTHMYRQDQVHVCVEVRGQLQHCSPNSVHLVGLGFLLFFKIIFVCRVCVYAFNGQKRVALNPLELELQAIVRNSVVAGK